MEEDLQILLQAESGATGPTVRFYTWREPTVSLGYHQSESVLELERMSRSHVPWVRRPTGGAAVLHSEELTYSVVLPWEADCAGTRTVQELISKAIAEGLQAAGIPAAVEARGEPLESLSHRASCFVRTSRWEVSVGGRKMVGSAQRKLSRAILQHGSILLGNDHLRIAEFLKTGSEIARDALRQRLAAHSISASEAIGRDVTAADIREPMAASFRKHLTGFLESLDSVNSAHYDSHGAA